MKKILFIIGILCISAIALPQACPIVTNVSFTAVAGGNALTVSYTGNGAKHIEYYIYCNNIEVAHDCFDTKGDGTQTSATVTCAGVLGYILIPGTGTCINGTTCGDTIRSPQGGPLPVTLENFTAQRRSNNVTINWQTQQELNVKSFEVQRGYNSSNYITISTILAHGNSSIPQAYSYTDNSNSAKGISFYRLKVVDVDGKVSYTYIKSVKGIGVSSGFIIFPNPSHGNAKITISDINEATTVQVIDNTGRLVKEIAITNNSSIELNNLKSGTYFVKTIGKVSGETSVEKLSVVN